MAFIALSAHHESCYQSFNSILNTSHTLSLGMFHLFCLWYLSTNSAISSIRSHCHILLLSSDRPGPSSTCSYMWSPPSVTEGGGGGGSVFSCSGAVITAAGGTESVVHSKPFNSWRACAARVTVAVLPVCLSVDAYSGTTGYEVANERYQRLQKYVNLKKLGDFSETTALERYAVKTSQYAQSLWLTSN